jgi:hypothetical protein
MTEIEMLKKELAKALADRDLANGKFDAINKDFSDMEDKLEICHKRLVAMRKVLIDYDKSDVGYLLWNAERKNIIKNSAHLEKFTMCNREVAWYHKEFAPDDNIFYKAGESRPEGCIELFTKVKF